MDEIASLTVWTVTLGYVDSTLLCLVFGVNLLVALQFMRSVGELALFLIRAKSVFHELFA